MEIIEAAMVVFREKGYQDTTIRDVADRVGILNGSLYYHFTSKDALYAEVHELALSRVAAELLRVVAQRTEPWERLEAACVRHLQMQAAPDSATMALMSELPRVAPDLRATLVIQRDAFETIYRDLVEALPLDAAVDRSLYRTLLLTMLNAVPAWFKPGLRTIEDVAGQILLLFRREAK
jgi:TetR/AcrR family transcriptional regulator, cholesterol catabolism regulator